MINQTKDGIYYLHNYTPVRRFNYCSEEEVAMSRQIWAYKNKDDEDTFNTFTNEMMRAIVKITNNSASDKIALVAVPPSKVGKKSTIAESIRVMKNWYDQGFAQSCFGCNKRIMDFSTLLTRASNVNTSHEGPRATYDEHKKSIVCSRDRLFRYRAVFIILDDVTTTGTIMNVCKDILIEQGAKKQYMYRLAIAQTV